MIYCDSCDYHTQQHILIPNIDKNNDNILVHDAYIHAVRYMKMRYITKPVKPVLLHTVFALLCYDHFVHYKRIRQS